MKQTDIRKEFGLRVQFFRKQRRLTQAELAEKIERTEDTISNIERGISSTRIETAARIAEVLKIQLTDLFDLPLFAGRNREKSELIKELVAIALDQDTALIKAFLEHIRNLSEIR
jgi:transcriptional regulator with XRE-family HTH domain